MRGAFCAALALAAASASAPPSCASDPGTAHDSRLTALSERLSQLEAQLGNADLPSPPPPPAPAPAADAPLFVRPRAPWSSYLSALSAFRAPGEDAAEEATAALPLPPPRSGGGPAPSHTLPRGLLLATSTSALHLFDTVSGVRIASARAEAPLSAFLPTTLPLSANISLVVAGRADGGLQLFSLSEETPRPADGAAWGAVQLHPFPFRKGSEGESGLPRGVSSAPVLFVEPLDFSPNPPPALKKLLLARSDGRLSMVEMATGRTLAETDAHGVPSTLPPPPKGTALQTSEARATQEAAAEATRQRCGGPLVALRASTGGGAGGERSAIYLTSGFCFGTVWFPPPPSTRPARSVSVPCLDGEGGGAGGLLAARFDGVSTTRAFALTRSNELLKLALLSAADSGNVGAGRHGGCRILSRLQLPPPLSVGNFSASLAVLSEAKLILLARSNGQLALFDSSHSPPPPPLPGDVRPTLQVPPRLLLTHSTADLRSAMRIPQQSMDAGNVTGAAPAAAPLLVTSRWGTMLALSLGQGVVSLFDLVSQSNAGGSNAGARGGHPGASQGGPPPPLSDGLPAIFRSQGLLMIVVGGVTMYYKQRGGGGGGGGGGGAGILPGGGGYSHSVPASPEEKAVMDELLKNAGLSSKGRTESGALFGGGGGPASLYGGPRSFPGAGGPSDWRDGMATLKALTGTPRGAPPGLKERLAGVKPAPVRNEGSGMVGLD